MVGRPIHLTCHKTIHFQASYLKVNCSLKVDAPSCLAGSSTSRRRLAIQLCKATWKREFKLPWREAGLPNHHDDKVDLDQ